MSTSRSIPLKAEICFAGFYDMTHQCCHGHSALVSPVSYFFIHNHPVREIINFKEFFFCVGKKDLNLL